MDALFRVLFEGPLLLLSGIIFVLFGGAGLLATGRAGHTRRRTAGRTRSAVELLIGVLLTTAGVTALLSG